MAITLISSSFLCLLLVYLSYGVSKERLRSKTDLGDGGDPALLRAIRAQGNLIEYAPMGLILIGLLETAQVQRELVMALAITFVVGRYMHGLMLGKIEGKNRYRFWGTVLTWLTLIIGAIVGLMKGYSLI